MKAGPLRFLRTHILYFNGLREFQMILATFNEQMWDDFCLTKEFYGDQECGKILLLVDPLSLGT